MAIANNPAYRNLAAVLSYVLGRITGLIFFLLRPYVRFHATQSIVVFLGLHILQSLLGGSSAWGMVWGRQLGLFTLGGFLLNLLSLLSLILWIVLMVKAFQGVRFKVLLAGDIAEGIVG